MVGMCRKAIVIIIIIIIIIIMIPTRYQTFSDAMDICEELGERGSFLTNFQSYNEYCNFIQSDPFCSSIKIHRYPH